jgi:hypothetical protein
MQRIALSIDNRSDAGTLSGGAWLGPAPLANLQKPLLSQVARSVDATAASTRLDLDLLNTSTVVRLVALARHNCSIDATYRVTAGTASGAGDIYDSGTLPVWPALYASLDLPWEAPNFWDGRPTAEEIKGYPISLIHDCAANVLARYWRLQITDTANAAGYIELARLWMGPLWQPVRNFAYGASLVWESRSIEQRSLGGVVYGEPRRPARVYRFTLPRMTATEAYGVALDLQLRQGTLGELWVIPNLDDRQRLFRRSFLARMRGFDPITQGLGSMHTTTYEMEERL